MSPDARNERLTSKSRTFGLTRDVLGNLKDLERHLGSKKILVAAWNHTEGEHKDAQSLKGLTLNQNLSSFQGNQTKNLCEHPAKSDWWPNTDHQGSTDSERKRSISQVERE